MPAPEEDPHGGRLDPWTEMDQWLEEDEFDTPEEVAAVFRAKRRLSFLYGGLFFLVTVSIPILNSTWTYWVATRIWGGFTLAYLAIHFLYPLFYILLGIAYSVQVNRVEEELLGRVTPTRRGR